MPATPRILMLVPHDPAADPRIEWTANTCATIAPTTVIGVAWAPRLPTRELRGNLLIERVAVADVLSPFVRNLWRVGSRLQGMPSVTRHTEHRVAGVIDRGATTHLAEVARFTSAWMFYLTLVDALWRRARAESVAPAVIVAHDLYGLMAGVRAKQQFNSRLLYDTHEFWPQADLLGYRWQEELHVRLERRLTRSADRVVTVSPPLARHLERLYQRETVISVPNATPQPSVAHSSRPARDGDEIVFLLQGQVAAGRGIELLLRAWETLDEPRAVLWIRAQENAFLSLLRTQFAGAIARGVIVIKDPVPEEQLVEAAATADVGVIPYIGPNLNHVYACPNKLSQYMQAGLPVLATTDMRYVSSLLEEYECGFSYDAYDPSSLKSRVRQLIADPALRQRLSDAARNASKTSFNWESVSGPYENAVRELISDGARP